MTSPGDESLTNGSSRGFYVRIQVERSHRSHKTAHISFHVNFLANVEIS